jgi:hypothetical protein
VTEVGKSEGQKRLKDKKRPVREGRVAALGLLRQDAFEPLPLSARANLAPTRRAEVMVVMVRGAAAVYRHCTTNLRSGAR